MEIYKGKRIQDEREIGKVRKVKVRHDMCGPMHFDYVLFPIGFKYNEDIQSLRKGDVIKFLDGSEHVVVGVVGMTVGSAVLEYLCQMRYGISIERAIEVWQDRLVMSRQDKNQMSKSECLIVFFEK